MGNERQLGGRKNADAKRSKRTRRNPTQAQYHPRHHVDQHCSRFIYSLVCNLSEVLNEKSAKPKIRLRAFIGNSCSAGVW